MGKEGCAIIWDTITILPGIFVQMCKHVTQQALITKISASKVTGLGIHRDGIGSTRSLSGQNWDDFVCSVEGRISGQRTPLE